MTVSVIIDPIIYTIFNIINDKCYVGQAARKHHRWQNHKIALRTNKHANKHLQNAYNKYGKDAFIFVVLENLFDISNLDERENYWIKALKPEYNKAPVAGSNFGVKHTDATKQKWSEHRKGQKRTGAALDNLKKGWEKRGPVSEEAKENMRQAQLGKKQSEETKAKRKILMAGNIVNNGRKQSQEQIEARAKILRGKPKSEEHKLKISEGNKSKFVSDETRAKQSLAAKNRKPMSEETRKKLSDSAYRQWNNA